MNRFFLVLTTIVLFVPPILSGCAGKKVSDATTLSEPQPADATVASTEQATAVSAPGSATLATSEGVKLKTVYFAYDSYTLGKDAQQALEYNAAWLSSNPGITVTIEGNCDERGSDEYNFALGENRALTVKNYLVALGISPDRLATISYGEERPAVTGHDEAAWAQNRRAEIH